MKLSNKNYMIYAIDRMCEDGNFKFIVSTKKKLFFYISDNDLIVQIFSDGGVKTISKEKSVNAALSILAYYTFNANKDTCPAVNSNANMIKNSTLRLRMANRIFSVFSEILSMDEENVRSIIVSDSFVTVFRSVAALAEINETILPKEAMIELLLSQINNFQTVLADGMLVYQKMNSSHELESHERLAKEWESINLSPSDRMDRNTVVLKEENTEEVNGVPAREEKIKLENVKIDTSSLENANIAFEFINDRAFLTNPAIARETEIRRLGATLLTPSYSAILLGHPGVGKTAIIEGLAFAIKNGKVSEKLMNKRIIKITPTDIVSGCTLRGQFEEKMQILINFLKTNHDIILYIDELHSALGVGTAGNSKNDVLNILKPFIENGRIRMIGATTIDEYNKVLKNDPAFTRRFKTITVEEPVNEILTSIIKANIGKYEIETGIKFANSLEEEDAMLQIITETSTDAHRVFSEKRYNPALVLSILEEAFGYACYDGSDVVSANYLIEALRNSEMVYKSTREDMIKKLAFITSSSKKSETKIIEFKPKK